VREDPSAQDTERIALSRHLSGRYLEGQENLSLRMEFFFFKWPL
jgi:hypothetical protein